MTRAACANEQLRRSTHFTGKERDSESGNDYFGARYYASTIGRFMSRDPEDGKRKDPASFHKYLYANGDPVDAIDPTGRADLFETALIPGGSLPAYPGLVATGYAVAQVFCDAARILAWALQTVPPGVVPGGAALKPIPPLCTAFGF